MKRLAIAATTSMLALGACEEQAEEQGLPDVGCFVENCDAAHPGDETWDCLYEAELPESLAGEPFPVFEFTATRRGAFCRWDGRRLQYVVQIGGECPTSRTFDATSRTLLPELPTGRLLKKVKVGLGEDTNVADYQEVNCSGEGAYAFPDNAASRGKAEELGILSNTERFRIEGEIRDNFTLEVGVAQLRSRRGLPIVATFYSPEMIEVYWKPIEYPFQVNACEETLAFLADYGGLYKDATCETPY